MNRTFSRGLALLSAVLSTASYAQVNLLTNGSFESGPSVPPIASFTAGSAAITGWAVLSGNIDYSSNTFGFWVASNGTRSIDLNGNAAGTIAQTFSTVVGQPYLVQFDLAGNFYGGFAVKPVRVSVAGQTQDFFFDSTGRTATDMGWRTDSLVFTAASGISMLTFASLNLQEAAASCPNVNLGPGPACFGAALDNVRVTAIPEPSQLALLLLGIASICSGTRRRNAP
jgi:choice-of-anchor C domain-containing protein